MNDQNSRDDTDAAPEHPNNEIPNNENYINESHNMAALLESEGVGIDFPNQGDIREGVIASIASNQILVSIGVKSEGIISGKEYEQIPEDERKELKVGDRISVYVINPEDQNGNLVLSFNRAQEEASWELAEKLLKDEGVFHGAITGYNKGGLIVLMGRLRGFVPASQISFSRRLNVSGETPEQRWGKMVGEEIDVCVIEVDRERRRLILSERAASTETRESLKDMVIDSLEIGEVRSGRVTSLADFGAFVNISGADGLVHLSEITWDRINSPSDVLSVGQEVEVKIISVDRDKKRIGLSIRQLLDDPWSNQVEKFQVGQLVEGSVTRLTKFGAFARLDDDFEGLIHISEISEKRIEHPKEVLHEGDVVTLRIIKIDPDNHRIGLSMRKVESMAYADMDWETLLEESLNESGQGDMSVEVPAAEALEVTPPDIEDAVESSDEMVDNKKEEAKKPLASAAKLPKVSAEGKKVDEISIEIVESATEEKKPAKARTIKPKELPKEEKPATSAKNTIADKKKTVKTTKKQTEPHAKDVSSTIPPKEVAVEKAKLEKQAKASTKKTEASAKKEKVAEPAVEKAKSAKLTKKPKKDADKAKPAAE